MIRSPFNENILEEVRDRRRFWGETRNRRVRQQTPEIMRGKKWEPEQRRACAPRRALRPRELSFCPASRPRSSGGSPIQEQITSIHPRPCSDCHVPGADMPRVSAAAAERAARREGDASASEPSHASASYLHTVRAQGDAPGAGLRSSSRCPPQPAAGCLADRASRWFVPLEPPSPGVPVCPPASR